MTHANDAEKKNSREIGSDAGGDPRGGAGALRGAGYERATVRDIAASASIDPALVIRYFGSKEALFVRAADFELRLPDLTQTEPSQLGAR